MNDLSLLVYSNQKTTEQLWQITIVTIPKLRSTWTIL